MADITMCTQTLCPNSGHCYRVQAKASDWQSMAMFDYTISVRGVECDNYMPIHRTVAATDGGLTTSGNGVKIHHNTNC